MLKAGIYEQVINKKIKDELDLLEEQQVFTGKIDSAEASKILSKYITGIIEKGMDNLFDKEDMSKQISLANKIVETIINETQEDYFEDLTVEETAEQLLALLESKDPRLAIKKPDIVRPETSISQSSLFTGSVHEPQMFSELKKEIQSSDKIDMLVSFIKWSGLRLIIEPLREFTQKGGKLRIITTSYMGATDLKAIEELEKLPNTEIKVSYDTKRTRLHAKTYVFYRNTGFTTAYVGSSNLSNAAISSGLEWNVKITKKDLPETLDKIEATFESYWNTYEFESYQEDDNLRLKEALQGEKYKTNTFGETYYFDILPYSYQQEILDRLEAERNIKGRYKNLIVAATGTGKTVISAFDYKRFRNDNPDKLCRLLFVAHREEILLQSRATFRGILKDNNFGELYVGKHLPETIDHLFISVQTFNSQKFNKKTTADFYDYIVVDETHHSTADSYEAIFSHYTPQILLGLTATPERMDGEDILKYFDHKIATEIRLPEAIDRKLLCPFQYFGVTDDVDLSTLKWQRGGYDQKELSNIYSFSGKIAEKRGAMIVNSVRKYVTEIDEVKGLGFCVSVDHAKFMADIFNKSGIPSIELTGTSSDEIRKTAKERLVKGEIKFIFVVDIYNEGVDIPEVNTVLFLRPTESLTVFLQQLGRGLRLSEKKECLTVLDFIGQANKKYNFEYKLAALLSNSNKSIEKEIKDGFVSAPKGCYIQLEKQAQKYILDNIKSYFHNKNGIVSRIATFKEDTGLELNLENFLSYYHLDIRSMYKHESFARLCVIAGVKPDFSEQLEEVFKKSLLRFASIDSRRLIDFVLEALTSDKEEFLEVEYKMLQMLQFTLWQKTYEDSGYLGIEDLIKDIKRNPNVCNELIEILKYNFERIDFVDEKVELGINSPLDLHCTYSRDQFLVALDFFKPNAMREGVKYLEDKKIDIFLVTLNKSDKDYSPSTMYNDYSINDVLFHWQSQSTTSSKSPTGQRYINHKETGNRILLFVREYKKDKLTGATMPYTYLGTANYVYHEGSNPMNITWKLDRPIPAKFLKKTNKLVVG